MKVQQLRRFSTRYFIPSALYVPGNQERMLKKCVTTRAALIVPDVEDSVPPQEKEKARQLILSNYHFLRESSFEQRLIMPRTNGPERFELLQEDLRCLVTKEGAEKKLIEGFTVPKIDTVEDIKCVDEVLRKSEGRAGVKEGHFKLVVQVESAKSVVFLKDILIFDQNLHQRIIACVLGGDDLTADLEIDRPDNGQDQLELDYSRRVLVMTSLAFGVVPMDTPFVNFKNLDALREELAYLKRIGIKGKFAIHPTNIDPINEILGISSEQVQYYQRVVSAFEAEVLGTGKAAMTFEDKMIDIAAYRRAKAFLALAQRTS